MKRGSGDASFKHTTSSTGQISNSTKRETNNYSGSQPGSDRDIIGISCTSTGTVVDPRVTKFYQCRTRWTISPNHHAADYRIALYRSYTYTFLLPRLATSTSLL